MLNRRHQQRPDHVAIDLGGSHTRFYSADKGLILDEPSVTAIDMDHPHGGATAAGSFGNLALKHIEEDTGNLRLIHPLQADLHNDTGLTEKMLNQFITTAVKSRAISRAYEVELVPPANIGQRKLQNILDTCLHAGATDVKVCDFSTATHNASRIDNIEPGVVIDFGARGSRLIACDTDTHIIPLAFGGDQIDATIANGMRITYDLLVSMPEAQIIKHRIAAATPNSLFSNARTTHLTHAVDIKRNEHTQFRIGSDTISHMLVPLFDNLAQSVRGAINSLPARLIDRAIENGIQLCGGGANLARLDQLLMDTTDLPVQVIKRPQTSIVRGAVKTNFAESFDPQLLETA